MSNTARGGALIIALPVCLATTVTTGLMGYGEQSKGPLAAVLVTDAKPLRVFHDGIVGGENDLAVSEVLVQREDWNRTGPARWRCRDAPANDLSRYLVALGPR
jgi:hypothetical protein